MACVIHNVLGSNFANMMIKYTAARKLLAMIPNAKLSNYNMEYWGIRHPAVDGLGGAAITMAPASAEMELNFERAAYLARSGLVERIDLYGHLQRMENLLSREDTNALFETTTPGAAFSDDEIACPVRGAETLTAIHPGYTLIPIRFYSEIIERSGLRPVFMGQVGDDVYSHKLRETFPQARFLTSTSPISDFQTIRRAKHIVVPVSTFAWLAAWLSEAKSVFMPVYGLFNPQQWPQHDLLPVGDRRYRFFQFPPHNAVPVASYEEAHASLTWEERPASSYVRA